MTCADCGDPIKAGRRCGPCVAASVEDRQTVARIEARLAAARAARLARERATGQRTFTVESGWQQRAGRCCMDGEMRLSEVAND